MADIRLGYLNSITLLARVTQDPDLRFTPKGTAVLGFNIACNRRYRDQATDEWKEEAYYFTANVWGQQAERLGETMKRGSAVLVEGELRSRAWETQSGDKRTAIEIHARRVQVLDKFGERRGADTPPPPGEEPAAAPDGGGDALDDIPF
jgi:single-strand DNA-binding protein